MKKKNLKSLSLSKRTISKLSSNELTGGTRTSNLCTVFCTVGCTPPEETYSCDQCDVEPTLDEGSDCNCL
ncbi:MAG: class I lanthipeptide [Bacteroidota bacterium]